VRTVAVGRAPLALAVADQPQHVFVANFGSHTVSMLDASSGAVLATTAVVPYPDTLAVATTPGRVFVASSVTPTGLVDVLDASTGRLLRTVAVGQGSHAFALDERAGHVFVTNRLDNSVSMVDARRAAALRTIPVGSNPLAITVDEHLSHAFVPGGGLWHNQLPSGGAPSMCSIPARAPSCTARSWGQGPPPSPWTRAAATSSSPTVADVEKT
jgi:YVTN family beta-propeller protein